MLFQGAEAINLDAKGRMAVPTRQRDDLLTASAGQLTLTANPQRCLILYPKEVWLPIFQKINAMPSFVPASDALKRVIGGNARDVSLDAAGRLLIAPELREYAKLEKRVWLVGQGRYFEIWSDTGWLAQLAQAEKLYADGIPAGFEGFAL